MQNNVIRYILNAFQRTHIGSQEFKHASLLQGHHVNQLKLNHMYDINNRTAPGYLLCHIAMVLQQHCQVFCAFPLIDFSGIHL